MPRLLGLVALGVGYATAQTCLDTTTVTQLTFTGATTVISNLGDQGGRAGSQNTPGVSPQQIYMRNVGFAKTVNSANGRALDLRVTALTEYRASNADLNGGIDSDTGAFMVVNVINPNSGAWHNDINFVDLQIEIMDQTTGLPLDITGGFETWLTMYDFDELGPNPTRRGIECTQSIPTPRPFPGSLVMYTETATELETLTMATIAGEAAADTTYSGSQYPDGSGAWSSATVYCSTVRGIGDDNPIDAIALTTQQKARSVYMNVRPSAVVQAPPPPPKRHI